MSAFLQKVLYTCGRYEGKVKNTLNTLKVPYTDEAPRLGKHTGAKLCHF